MTAPSLPPSLIGGTVTTSKRQPKNYGRKEKEERGGRREYRQDQKLTKLIAVTLQVENVLRMKEFSGMRAKRRAEMTIKLMEEEDDDNDEEEDAASHW